MSYSSLPFTSKLFQLTSLTCALALAGCGGGDSDTVDSVAPAPDLGVQQPGTGGNNGSGDNNNGGEQTPTVEPDFFLQKITVRPNIIELSDKEVVFEVTVKAVEKNSGGAVINKDVRLKVEDSENNGITIEGQSVQTTDNDGNALYTLKLNPQAVANEAELIKNGFTLMATANTAAGKPVAAQSLKVSISKKGSGDGTQVEVSKLDIKSLLSTSSVSNNALNPYGDSAKLTITAKNSNGARVQNVKVGLGIDSIKGISIVGGSSKDTNADGIVTFSIKIDENLSKSERDALLKGEGIAYAISIQEQGGATKQKTGILAVKLPVSDYVLDLKGRDVVLNGYGDDQPLIITASPKNDKVPTNIKGAKATIKLNNAISGVKLSTEALVFDASGKAIVNLIVAPTLSAAQRKAIVDKGISYTVVLSEPNRAVTTETYASEAYIPESQYQIKFATKNKNRISSFGSDVVISFRVNDKEGGAIANQKVTVSLPINLIKKGLLNLDSAATQVTDSKGMASYNVSVPAGLTTAQRAELESVGGFILTAKVTETSGASSSINSERIQVTAESETILNVKNIPSAVNILKSQFQIQVAGKRPDGSAAAAKNVKLTISNITGVSIQGSEQTTDASGNAIFTVNLSQDLTQTQRQALVNSGIPYTVTLTDEDGVATNNYKAPVIIPVAEYKLNFGSNSSDKLLSTGGVTTLSFRVNDKNGGVIANQTVTASLPSNLTQKGLITLESAASQVTDAQGNVSYTVRIPAGLSATQRLELETANGFVLNARLVEASGANINTSSNRVSITADPSRSKTILTAKTTPSVVNVLKDQFTIQISAKRPGSSAAAGKVVKLAINNVKGISIEGSEQTTNSAGKAVFTVNIDQGLTLEQRKALEKTGIAYTATLTDDDGIATESYSVKASVPSAEYKINFGSSSNAQLSSSGGSSVISFRVNDKDGGVIGNQKVTVSLPKSLVNSGLLTLDSAATQTTDNKGVVSYSVRVPAGLSTAQKSALEKASGFVLTANLIEASGANSTTNSVPINISNKVQKSLTVLTSETNPKVVNVLKDQFTIRVSGKRKDGSPAADKAVKLELDKLAGVTVKDNEQVTDATGNATFIVNVSQDLTQAQREALKTSGITYTASLTDNDGVVTSNYNASVINPATQYKVNFGTSDKVQLSSSGGSAIISFRVNDKNGGVIANQNVTVTLPKNLVDSGLLTLDSAATQTTNGEGVVSYKVSIPAGLTKLQKDALEAKKDFVLTAKAVEASGASSSISSSSIRISAAVEKSSIKLTSISSPKVVTVTDKQFTIQVSAKLFNGSVAAGKKVKLVIQNVAGVSIQGNEQTTNEAGNAVFTVNLSQDLTATQRAALIKSGIAYTAILTDDDGTEAQIKNTVKVEKPATTISFDSIITPSISEFGGSGSIIAKLLTKGDSPKPVKNQKVNIQLGAKAIDYGVTVNQPTATTDFNGEATFIIDIPKSLTAEQRAEIKNESNNININYQLSYTEKDITYDSKVQQVALFQPAIALSVLNAPTDINNRDGYTLNEMGDSITIQAQLSNKTDKTQIANQPVELNFKDKSLAKLLTVNGNAGSASVLANTDTDGIVSFEIVVSSNLTPEEKETLRDKVLTATLTETLTAQEQEVNIKVQSMDAAISLRYTQSNLLNLNGGETQIEVTVADKKGGIVDDNGDIVDSIVAGQKVFFALSAAIASQGVTLVSGNSQTTDDSGRATFTLAVPSNLTKNQKEAISTSFATALSAVDANGNIVTEPVTINTVTPVIADTQESLTIGANKVVNTEGDTFKVFVRVAGKNGKDKDNNDIFIGMANRDVRLNVDDSIKTGVTITNNTVKTNGDGVATFELKLEKGESVDQEFLKSGIRITATTNTAENTELKQNYILAVNTVTIDDYKIWVSSDKSTLNTGGDQTNATIRITDSRGGILVGVPVQLSIKDSLAVGAALTTPSIVMTDAEGKVEAGVILAANSVNARLNSEVEIIAEIITPEYDENGYTKMKPRAENSLILSTVGTQLNIEASLSELNPGDSTTITTKLVDGSGRAIANADMELVDVDDNSLVDIVKTDADGIAEFTLTRVQALTFDNSGNLRVFARALGERKLVTQRSINSINLINVSQAGISFMNLKELYDANETHVIDLQVRTDSSIQADELIGESIEVKTTLGTFANNKVVTTRRITEADIDGNIIRVPVTLTSKFAGTAVLQATVMNGSNVASPKYQTSVDLRFRATTPATMSLQAVRSTIVPNSSTEIIALIKDKDGVPVEGETVVFSRSTESSTGRLSAATAITNNKGEARVVYQANASTAINGVVINAELRDKASIKQTVNITVSKEAVYSTLAFSNDLQKTSDGIYYTLAGSISVMDGSGRAVPSQEVSLKSYAIEYAQGNVCVLDSNVSYQTADKLERYSEQLTIPMKSGWFNTEDPDYNYTLEKDDDLNNNNRLDAINPVSIIGSSGLADDNYTFMTDEEGRADFSIRYPIRYANWVKVRFDASTRLNGSENRQSLNFVLPYLPEDVGIINGTLKTPWANNTSAFGAGGAQCIDSMSINIDDVKNTTKVALTPSQDFVVNIDGIDPTTTSQGFNSLVLDFNQAFSVADSRKPLAKGAEIRVSNSGFSFKNVIRIN